MKVATVSIGKVRSAGNIRTSLGDLADLTASIRSVGILEPILVTQNGASYVVVAGHRRLAAARKAGLAEVPVVVRPALEAAERVEVMLIENLQREDLQPTDEAAAYRQLLDGDYGYSQKSLAERIGRSEGHISKRLALLTLTDKARAALNAGAIHIDDALKLAKLRDHPKRIDEIVATGRVSDYEVRDHLREIETDRKVAEATAALQSAGTKIVGWTKGAYGSEKLKGTAVLVDEGYAYEAHVRMSPKAHAKETCHAAAIGRRGEVLEVCTSPKNHPKEYTPTGGRNETAGRRQPGGLTEKEKAARKAKREHNAAIREAEVERWTFLRSFFDRGVPLKQRDVAIRFLVEAWHNRSIGTSWSHVGESARQLLGGLPDRGDVQMRPAIMRAMDKATEPADALKVALAIGVGGFEDGIRMDIGNEWSGSWTRAKAYFRWLEEIGYSPSEAERVAVSGKAPR